MTPNTHSPIPETPTNSREDLIYELENWLLLSNPNAAHWFTGEEPQDQDELLEKMADYIWCYHPVATLNDALHWLSDQIEFHYKENVEIAYDGRC